MSSDNDPRSDRSVHSPQRPPDSLILVRVLLKIMFGAHDDEVSFSIVEGIPAARE